MGRLFGRKQDTNEARERIKNNLKDMVGELESTYSTLIKKASTMNYSDRVARVQELEVLKTTAQEITTALAKDSKKTDSLASLGRKGQDLLETHAKA
jgi:hypothetical protein